MKKGLIIIIFAVGILSATRMFVSAGSESDVSIIVNSDQEQYTKQLDVDVTVKFNKQELYNDQVYLSYHVYDSEHNEILWEGQRFPLSVDNLGKGRLQTVINLKTGVVPLDDKQLVVEFDLVDEMNLYWFSSTPHISLSSDQITYVDSFLSKFRGTLVTSIDRHPVIFSINAIILMLFVCVLFVVKRKRLL